MNSSAGLRSRDTKGAGGRGDIAIPEALKPESLGTACIEPQGKFIAGSYQTFSLTYTAGVYGIDDSGSLRICFRFATDQGRPQFDDPSAPNYTTIKASNNARLDYRFDHKSNVRPWDRTIYIKVVDGFLREGDRIEVCFGDKSKGSPGFRLQTFCEKSFTFRVLVDPIATFNYQPVLEQPAIEIVPGMPVRYIATVPTLWRAAQPFPLHFKGEDQWGNPTDRCDLDLTVISAELDHEIAKFRLAPGRRAIRVEGLSIDKPGDYRLNILNSKGHLLCRANPIRIEDGKRFHVWGDLHGQSEETIGTNSAHDYFAFARDLAPLDVTSHQGNDFQITKELWRELDHLAAEFDTPGRFVVLPGYEWSGNTGLGGDRNVYFPEEGRTIRRSSHALIEDKSDIDSDCTHAQDLFDALERDQEWDVVVFAHCGGRYADLQAAHDGRFERSVEIHSSWGTFDWILHDAFDLGARVGIVANSDGHKGRPGASYPGSSLFGAIGGLTCFFVEELSRPAVLDCLRKRHHFATTGGPNGRLLLDVSATFPQGGRVFHDDPNLFDNTGMEGIDAMMGDIVHLPKGDLELRVEATAGCPIERVELFQGRKLLEIVRPYQVSEDDKRIRLLWTGARYRGRFRQVIWDGQARISGNRIESLDTINFFNPEKQATLNGQDSASWQSLTTGNTAGVDLHLEEASAGALELKSGPIEFTIPLRQLRDKDHVEEVPGPLPRYMRVTRLPARMDCLSFDFSRKLTPAEKGDSPYYTRITLEDGTVAWSSPIYFFRE